MRPEPRVGDTWVSDDDDRDPIRITEVRDDAGPYPVSFLWESDDSTGGGAVQRDMRGFVPSEKTWSDFADRLAATRPGIPESPATPVAPADLLDARMWLRCVVTTSPGTVSNVIAEAKAWLMQQDAATPVAATAAPLPPCKCGHAKKDHHGPFGVRETAGACWFEKGNADDCMDYEQAAEQGEGR